MHAAWSHQEVKYLLEHRDGLDGLLDGPNVLEDAIPWLVTDLALTVRSTGQLGVVEKDELSVGRDVNV